MKKKLSVFFVMILFITSCCVSVVNATSTRASYYLDVYQININRETNGDICVGVTVVGTNTMDDIGAKTIYLLEKAPDATSWTNIKTFDYTSYPNMMGHDEQIYYCNVRYPGKEGYSYKAMATVYAGKDGGGDSRTITSVVIK